MLLNKITVLDKGYIAPLSFSGNGRLLQEIQDEFFKTSVNLKLLNIASATLVIKCPLYVQMNLSQSGLSIISTPSDDVEAYIPDVSMISGESLEDRQNIQKYMQVTTEALLLNQKSMTMDGCSRFTAQLLTPISAYSTIIVHGNLNTWIDFLNQKKIPREIANYRNEIYEVLKIEWANLDNLMKL